MTNAIATIDTAFQGLNGEDSAVDLLETNLGGGSLRSSDLTWIKIPSGGITTFSWTSKAGEDFTAKSIRGLLVVVGRTEQTLWPYQDAKAGSRPLLVSHFESGPAAVRVGDDFGELDPDVIEAAKNEDGTYDTRQIPYFNWQGRVPPRAKSGRVIGILRENEALPVFIRVSSTSLEPVNSLLRGLVVSGIHFFRAVVEFGLEKRSGSRADYAVLTAKKEGDPISVEAGKIAKARFTDVLTDVVCPPLANRVRQAASDAIPF